MDQKYGYQFITIDAVSHNKIKVLILNSYIIQQKLVDQEKEYT